MAVSAPPGPSQHREQSVVIAALLRLLSAGDALITCSKKKGRDGGCAPHVSSYSRFVSGDR